MYTYINFPDIYLFRNNRKGLAKCVHICVKGIFLSEASGKCLGFTNLHRNLHAIKSFCWPSCQCWRLSLTGILLCSCWSKGEAPAQGEGAGGSGLQTEGESSAPSLGVCQRTPQVSTSESVNQLSFVLVIFLNEKFGEGLFSFCLK